MKEDEHRIGSDKIWERGREGGDSDATWKTPTLVATPRSANIAVQSQEKKACASGEVNEEVFEQGKPLKRQAAIH